MIRRYEIVYVFDSAMDEAQVDEALARHQALLQPDGDSEFILETNHWGKRTLAYPIGNNEVGYYVVVNLKTEGDKLEEYERSLKLDESLIRYLVVLNEGEIPAPIPHPDDQPGPDDKKEAPTTAVAAPEVASEPAGTPTEPGDVEKTPTETEPSATEEGAA